MTARPHGIDVSTGLVDCALAVGFEKMERGSISTKVMVVMVRGDGPPRLIPKALRKCRCNYCIINYGQLCIKIM